MQYAALKYRSYEVHISDDATDNYGRPTGDSLAVSVSLRDWDASRKAITDPISYHENRHPLYKFLMNTLNEVTSLKAEDVQSNGFSPEFGDILPGYQGQERKALLVRGFLTSMVLSAYDSTRHRDIDQAAYVALREAGHRPFNIEQLQGMAETVVQFALDSTQADLPARRADS